MGFIFYAIAIKWVVILNQLFLEAVLMKSKKLEVNLRNHIKKYSTLLSLQRIEIKQLSGNNVFKVLKNLCEFENLITDNLMYVLSGYNGSIQQHINCLISIRFKSKVDNINIKLLSTDEIDCIVRSNSPSKAR